MKNVTRCTWANGTEALRAYHDLEWGVPVHDDRRWFEFLTLEGAQAGLSWNTILLKRDNYRTAFAGFDPVRVARFGVKEVAALLRNEGIVRNRLKIEATIGNARAFLGVQEAFGSFDRYIRRFAGGKPLRNRWTDSQQVPASSPQSDAMSRDLKQRGFRFAGTTICYAFMQATGLVNDHLITCFRYRAASRTRS
ncbi:MAG: DNA-3-methyladenine glycosylase I [Betaproteobacteria bacterium]